MSVATDSDRPFDDVRDLVARPAAPDEGCQRQVYDALLGMGREGDYGKLGDAAAWLAGWQRRYPPRVSNPTLAIFAGAHGLANQGVSL